MTHDELVYKAARWAKSIGFSVVLTELKANSDSGEIPDVLAFRNNVSLLIECKASFRDFIADSKKSFRKPDNALGVGDWRFYFAPAEVIPVARLPDGWGIVETSPKRIVNTLGVPPNTLWTSRKPFQGNKAIELDMIVSACRRSGMFGTSRPAT